SERDSGGGSSLPDYSARLIVVVTGEDHPCKPIRVCQGPRSLGERRNTMNCAKHPDLSASAFCRTCGKALCPNCTRDVRGVIYCEECLSSRLGETVPTTPPAFAGVPPAGTPVVIRQGGSPGLAALLSIIPGVGQMYNEQYAKGLIFILIFAALIQMTAHINGLFGLLIAGFSIYQIID